MSRCPLVSGLSVGTLSLYCEGTMIRLISNCKSALYLCEPELLKGVNVKTGGIGVGPGSLNSLELWGQQEVHCGDVLHVSCTDP